MSETLLIYGLLLLLAGIICGWINTYLLAWKNHHLAVENFNRARRLMLKLGWAEAEDIPEQTCREPKFLHAKRG